MRRVAIFIALAVAASGCGGNDREKLPAACIGNPDAIAEALKAAPAAVRIDGTAISHCFNRGASGTDSQVMGQTMLAAAQRLADAGDARSDLQLGYLVGAVRRGASRTGVHGELARRIEMEGRPSSEQYRRGRRAGLAKG
jgi:hypothetical protein